MARRTSLPRVLKPLAVSALALVLVLTVAGLALRILIATDVGRGAISATLRGQDFNGLRVVDVGEISGDPLKRFSVERLILADPEGPWLEISGLDLSWSPGKLFQQRLEIASVRLLEAHVIRRPTLAPREPRASAFDSFGLSLGDLTIDRLRIDPEALGVGAEFKVFLAAEIDKDRAGTVRLDLATPGGEGDHAKLDISWRDDGRIEGAGRIYGAPDTIVSRFLRAPAGQTVDLKGSIRGHLALLRAEAALDFSANSVGTLEVILAGPLVTADARLKTSAWPDLERLEQHLGPDVRLSAELNLLDARGANATVRATSGLTRLRASGRLNLRTGHADGPIETQVSGFPLSLLFDDLKGDLDLTGAAALSAADTWTWTGDGRASDVTIGEVQIRRVSAPVTVSMASGSLTWALEGGLIEVAPSTPGTDLVGARYDLSTTGDLADGSRSITISSAKLKSVLSSFSATGSIDASSGAFRLSGDGTVSALSSRLPVSGSLRGNWRAERRADQAHSTITIETQGMGLSSPIDAISALLGPAPRLTASAKLFANSIEVTRARFEGDAFQTDLDGRLSPDGSITARAEGRLLKTISSPLGRIDALAARATVTGPRSHPEIVLRFSEGAAVIAGQALTSLGGDLRLELGRQAQGAFALEGAANDQRLSGAGEIVATQTSLALRTVRAALGGLTFTSPSLRIDETGGEGRFRLVGSLAGLAGVTSGAIRADGDFRLAASTLEANLSGRAEAIERGDLSIETALLDLRIDDGSGKLSARAFGMAGVRTDAILEAEGRAQADGWIGEARLSGRIANTPVTMGRPATWTWSPNDMRLDGAVNLLEGRIEGRLVRAPSVTSLNVEATDINLAAASALAGLKSVTGTVSGKGRLLLSEDGPHGSFTITSPDLGAAGFPSQAAKIEARGEIVGDRIHTQVSGKGVGFTLEGSGDIPLAPTHEFRISRSGALSGRLRLSGPIEPLWSVLGPDDQSLTGLISMETDIGGSLEAPEFRGELDLSSGTYEHGDTGFLLTNVSAQGRFDGSRLLISSFEGRDRARGRLSADGALSWSDRLEGELRFRSESLEVLSRDRLSAVLSGAGRLSSTSDGVEVTGDFTVSEARVSVDAAAAETIPLLPLVRRINFDSAPRVDDRRRLASNVRLNLTIKAPRRLSIFGRGLDTEWSAAINVKGPAADPDINGSANLLRGSLNLAGQRFIFDTGLVSLSGPARLARFDLSASRTTSALTARARVSGSIDKLKVSLSSTPVLPEDEVLARILFGRSAAELSALEAAQLAASLAQLSSGQAAFDPTALLRESAGLDRIALGASGDRATVSAGKYIAPNVYLEVGSGAEGGLGAAVEWEPREGLSVSSSADEAGDSRIAVRWKKTY
jgi:translocation and assembly module TamB